MTPHFLAKVTGSGEDSSRVFVLSDLLERALGLAIKDGEQLEHLEETVRRVFERLSNGRVAVEWGRKVADVFGCYQPFACSVDSFCEKLGQSGFRIGKVNAAFSWMPRRFDEQKSYRLLSAVEVCAIWPAIPMDQWGNTCASVTLVKLLGKLMSAQQTGELLPANALHALAVRAFANAGGRKRHDDDARAETSITAADSLHTPCEVGWLVGIVNAVFRDRVRLVKIVGVERDKVTHGRKGRTDVIPPNALEEYFVRALAPLDGKPTPLLLCIRGYCDSRMGTPMVVSDSSHRPGAPWEYNYLKPWTESQRKRLVSMIKDSSSQGAYDGHAVLVTGMFQGANSSMGNPVRWVIVEDHNEIAGPAGWYAMDASCLALITTDVFALHITPSWRPGIYADLFPPVSVALVPANEEDNYAGIPKVFLADEGKKGRWCVIRRCIKRPSHPGGLFHVVAMVEGTAKSIHVAQGLLNAVAVAKWGAAFGDEDQEAARVQSALAKTSQQEPPLQRPGAQVEERSDREESEVRAARVSRRVQHAPPQQEPHVQRNMPEHENQNEDPQVDEGAAGRHDGVRRKRPRNELIDKRLHHNTLGVYKADTFALPVTDNFPPPYRRESRMSVRRCFKYFHLYAGMLRQSFGALEMEERAYRVGRAVWLLEMAIKNIPGERWRPLRTLVHEVGIISCVRNDPRLLARFLRKKARGMEPDVFHIAMEKLSHVKNEYYYYLNASQAPHLRLYAQSPGGRRKIVSTRSLVCILQFAHSVNRKKNTMCLGHDSNIALLAVTRIHLASHMVTPGYLCR